MSEHILTLTHYQTTSTEAREKILARLKEIASSPSTDHASTLRYCHAIPLADQSGLVPATGPVDTTSIYSVEEYSSRAAHTAHLADPVVQSLHDELTTNDSNQNNNNNLLMKIPPTILTVPLPPTQTYTRAARTANIANPFIILATFAFQPDTTTLALPGFQDFVAYCDAAEPETLGYTVVADQMRNELRTVEVYETREFVYDVHVKSEAVKRNGEQNGKWRLKGGLSSVKCEMVVGWLARSSGT